MITGKTIRKGKGDSFADNLASAAVAIVQALKGPSPVDSVPANSVATTHVSNIMSPTKKANLRSQYLKQLKEIQNLRDEGVLTLEEFQSEKDSILQTLKEFK